MPGTWRSEPFSPSSPQKVSPSVQPAGSSPVATSTPTAMARSSPAPPFRTPDGARLTVTRRRGQGNPLESRAARTRSRDSRTAASGSPTMVKPGSPLDTWTSTETGRPTAPMRVAVAIEASMPRNGRAQFESATATFRFSGDETPAIRTVACTRSCRSEFARNSRFRGEHPSGSTLQTPRGPATPRQGLGKHARTLSQRTGNTSEALSDRASTRSTSTAPCCSVAIWTSMPIARAPARYGGCQSIPTLDARSSP